MEESFPREKSKCDEGHAGFPSDLISKLPDSLISQILSYLETKDVVSISGVSKRWTSVWMFISELDLKSDKFPDYDAFVSFMNKVLNFSREQKLFLQKLKLSIHNDENDQSCLTRWIDIVASSTLKHLDVECPITKLWCLEVMPLTLYVCETLLYLRLHRVSLGKVESVSLPCLKAMSLELNVYADEASLELLISSCRVLEDLIIVRWAMDNVKVLRVHSQTLTNLVVKVDKHFDAVEGLLIDAPRLEKLELENEVSKSKIISNSGSLAKVIINGCLLLKNRRADVVDLPTQYMIQNFFTSISGVTDMKICCETFELFQEIIPLPQFRNLSSLEVVLSFHSLRSLPTFLEKFPNLKSLILVLLFCHKDEIRHSSVPNCILSSLEYVKIKSIFSLGSAAMEVARYFTENSVNLKKLVMRFGHSMVAEDKLVRNSIFLREILALQRRSSKCQFVVS